MGWTHYWYREIELPKEQFKAALKDCVEILEALNIPLGDAVGKDTPVLSGDAIIFNSVNNDCEPFVFRRIQHPRPGRDKVFTYCKTEHMSYDLAVQCCLIVLKHHFGDELRVCSDGKDDEWKKAREICEENLKYSPEFTLDSNK